jgi:hypothetical protein
MASLRGATARSCQRTPLLPTARTLDTIWLRRLAPVEGDCARLAVNLPRRCRVGAARASRAGLYDAMHARLASPSACSPVEREVAGLASDAAIEAGAAPPFTVRRLAGCWP